MLSLKHLQQAIIAFIEEQVLTEMSGIHKFLGYAGVFAMSQRSEVYFENLMQQPLIKSLNLTDDKGMIDGRKLYQTAKYAMEKTGKVTLYGVTFDKEALDLLAKYVSSVSGVNITKE